MKGPRPKKSKKDLQVNISEEYKDQTCLFGFCEEWKESSKFNKINHWKVSLTFQVKWKFQETLVLCCLAKEEITILWICGRNLNQRKERRVILRDEFPGASLSHIICSHGIPIHSAGDYTYSLLPIIRYSDDEVDTYSSEMKKARILQEQLQNVFYASFLQ